MGSRTRVPSSIDQDATGIEWTSPADATVADDVPAQVIIETGQESNLLLCTDFDFAIPEDATLEGIAVTLRCSAQPLGAGEAFTIFLVLGETTKGVKSADPASETLDDQVFGAADDLWSSDLTVADVNSATFGCHVKAGIVDITAGALFQVDDVEMTITYSGGTEPVEVVRRAGKVGIGVGVGI
jgi:hypothetical protein